MGLKVSAKNTFRKKKKKDMLTIDNPFRKTPISVKQNIGESTGQKCCCPILIKPYYSWLGTIFYITYLAFEWPQSLGLQRFPASKWLWVLILL